MGKEGLGEDGEETDGGDLVAGGGTEGNWKKHGYEEKEKLRIMEEKWGEGLVFWGGEVGMTGRRQGERHVEWEYPWPKGVSEY